MESRSDIYLTHFFAQPVLDLSHGASELAPHLQDVHRLND